jgi:hypothetical protein
MSPIPRTKMIRNGRLPGWMPWLHTEIQKTNFPHEL